MFIEHWLFVELLQLQPIEHMLHAKYKIRLIITRLCCLLVVLQVAFGSTCLFNSDCIQGYCKPDTLLCYNKSMQRSDFFFWMLESKHYLSKRLTDHHAPSIQIACRIFAVPTDLIPVTLQVQLFELMKAPFSHANLKKKLEFQAPVSTACQFNSDCMSAYCKPDLGICFFKS